MSLEKVVKDNPAMMVFITFVILFAVNAIVIYLANMFFPTWVVLGTIAFTLPWALFHSMLILALIDTFALPFIHKYELKRGKMFSTKEWMAAYFLINLAGIWGVARFSEQFGLGIKSWMVAVVLALVLDLVQGAAMMLLSKPRGK